MGLPVQKGQEVHWRKTRKKHKIRESNEMKCLVTDKVCQRRTTAVLKYHFVWVWWSRVWWRPRRFLWGSSGRVSWPAGWGSCWSPLCSRAGWGTSPGCWRWRFHHTERWRHGEKSYNLTFFIWSISALSPHMISADGTFFTYTFVIILFEELTCIIDQATSVNYKGSLQNAYIKRFFFLYSFILKGFSKEDPE